VLATVCGTELVAPSWRSWTACSSSTWPGRMPSATTTGCSSTSTEPPTESHSTSPTVDPSTGRRAALRSSWTPLHERAGPGALAARRRPNRTV